MSESVSHLPDEAYVDIEPSFVECILDDAQAWAQRALRDAESESSLLRAEYGKFLAKCIEQPVEEEDEEDASGHYAYVEEDISDRASTGTDLRGLLEIALGKAQAAREVIESGETSLKVLGIEWPWWWSVN